MTERTGYQTAAATAGERREELRRRVGLIYVLYALTLAVGITAVVGVIMAHVYRRETAGTWLESHLRWLIRTFWIAFVVVVAGYAGIMLEMLTTLGRVALIDNGAEADATLFFRTFGLVGLLTLAVLAAGIWFIYRVVRGGLRFLDGRPADVA